MYVLHKDSFTSADLVRVTVAFRLSTFKTFRTSFLYLFVCYSILCGRNTSVGIAIRYGLDGPGIESRWGARFSAPVQTGSGARPASCTMSTGSFPGIKRPGRGAEPPPIFSAEVLNRVELYLYLP